MAPRWTPQDDKKCIDLIKSGYGMRYVCAKTRRSYNSVVLRMTKIVPGGITAIRNNTVAVRSMSATADLLGVSEKYVAFWVRWGWLEAKQNQKVGRHRKVSHYRITDDAILAFLEERKAWPMWDVDSIADPEWRDYARQIRLRAGGYWVKVCDIRDYHPRFQYYTHEGVQYWLNKQLLPSLKIRNLRYVWSEHLDGFIPGVPNRQEIRYSQKTCQKCAQTCYQVKDGFTSAGSRRMRCQGCGYRYTPTPKPRGYAPDLRTQALKMYVDGLNFRRIGRLLGVHYHTVTNWVNDAAVRVPEAIPSPTNLETVEVDKLYTLFAQP